MILALEARTPCAVCGYLFASWSFPSVRVNRRSIRITGPGVTCGPLRACPECRTPFAAGLSTTFRLTAPAAAEVAEYRAKRWPELAAERAA